MEQLSDIFGFMRTFIYSTCMNANCTCNLHVVVVLCGIMWDSGVPFLIDGKVTYIRGTLTVVSADNPTANLVAGYKSLTSAFRKCRICMAVETDMQSKVSCPSF